MNAGPRCLSSHPSCVRYLFDDHGQVTSFLPASLSSGASLVAQTVKNLPARQETWVPSLGWEDLLEKGVATHSSILTWKISWTKEPGRLQSMGWQRVEHN